MLSRCWDFWVGWVGGCEGYEGSSQLIEVFRQFCLVAITAADENWLAHHKLTRGSQHEGVPLRAQTHTHTTTRHAVTVAQAPPPPTVITMWVMTSFKCSTFPSWQADWFFFPASAPGFVASAHLRRHLWGSISVRRVGEVTKLRAVSGDSLTPSRQWFNLI